MKLLKQALPGDELRPQAERLMQEAARLFLESKYKEALRASEEAFEIYQKLRDAQGIGKAAENLAGFNYHLGDYRQAVKYGRYSLRVTSRLEDKDGTSRALALLGGSYLFQGRYERALLCHTQSLKLAQESRDVHGEIRGLGNLAQVFAAGGKYVDALERIEQALARLSVEQHAGNDIFYVRLKNLQGAVFRVVGEHELANESFGASLQKSQEIGDPMGTCQALINLGIGLLLQKKYEEAIGYFDGSLKIKKVIGDPKGQGLALHNLGQCYEGLGRNEEALDHFRRSLDIARHIDYKEGEWQALGSIGTIHLKLKRPEQAKQYLENALQVACQVADNADVGEIYRLLSHVFIETKQYDIAVNLLRESIAHAEAVRANLGIEDNFKVSIFERHAEAYRELQWVLAEKNSNEEALEIAERGRARALAETLVHKIQLLGLEETGHTPPTLSCIRAIAVEQQTTLVVYSIVANPLDKLAGAEREVEIFTWVIPPDESSPLTFHRTGTLALEDLTERSNRVAALVGEAPRRDLNFISQSVQALPEDQELRFLHQLLIEPIEEALPKDEDALVTLIADSGLVLIPFAALKDKTNKYLIESHTISFSPSIQILNLTCRRRRTAGTPADGEALVVGNPEMPMVTTRLGQPPVKLQPLAHAEREAIEIGCQLGTQALIGPSATKAAVLFRLAQKRFIHLATHGIFDDLSNSKSQGAIALAPSGTDYGLLTAEEIRGLDLSAELAVLSACNTGQGRVAAEGVIGLSRAFIMAGTRSVVVSLWSVTDAPTAFLMTQFYAGFDQRGSRVNKAQALRRAMLQTMKEYPKPQDWGAFVLIGDPY